jgi:transposase
MAIDQSITPPVEGRPFRDHEGYLVAPEGGVWSCRDRQGRLTDRWHRLAPHADSKGYLRVGLRKSSVKHDFPIHHLVLEAFVGPCPEGMECCHSPDRNPGNNRLDNLRWDTPKGNQADKVLHGTQTRGGDHPGARLTEDQVVEVIGRARRGEAYRAIAKRLGVAPATISQITLGKTWAHVDRGGPIPQRRTGAKLTEAAVVEILAMARRGVTQTAIAGEFRVDRTNIVAILAGKTWKDIDRGPEPFPRRYGNARLDEEKAREIRALVASGQSRRGVAEEFGVSTATVDSIVTGKAWREVPPTRSP